jgi:uncharacterized cupredoxin-like copper-binding protein
VRPSIRSLAAGLALVGVVAVVGACEAGPVPATPPISPGTAEAPRDVNLIARDYAFVPATLDLVPGERVVLHVINGGLVTHEAILGDERVQDAWEVAEAAVAGAPPGPTPVVRVPDDVAGVRIVVESGQRVDLEWTVPTRDEAGPGFVVGCHIAGHWERGMQIPVRWVQPNRNVASPGTGVEATTP